MKKIRLGIVGTNFISDWFCGALGKIKGAVPHAVYSRREETGRAFAGRHSIPQVFTDYSEFLASGIEAVYLASPNALHYGQAMAAVAQGLHVLCEKPLVPSAAEFRTLASSAAARGVVLMEAMRPAHDPALAAVKEALSLLGPIRRATFEYCQYSSRYDRFLAGELPNAFNPALANAALLDIGIYPLFWCAALFGAPKSVDASSVFLHNGMEGEGSALLCYQDKQVLIVYSKISDSVTPSVISGERGSLTIDRLTKPQTLSYFPRGGRPESLDFSPVEDNIASEAADFLALIREGGANPFLAATGCALQIADAIRRKAGIRFDLS